MGEGGTPLIAATRLSARFGVEVWLKLEGMNPTGSFKDRGMAVAVSRAIERGARGVVCASTGNTAASAAAYAARGGVASAIVIPSGAVAVGKLAQARASGARIVEVHGSFKDAYQASLELAAEGGYTIVNSTNDDRIEGQKGAASEVLAQLGGLPDALLLPYGGGGNTKAYARGFEEEIGEFPRLYAAEAAHRSDTLASAIRIVEPSHRCEAEEAVARSRGAVVALSEDELATAWRDLAREEGVYCELASAAPVAALKRGVASPGECVVCVLTGHGLKDSDAITRLAE
jgi:threonine synthase